MITVSLSTQTVSEQLTLILFWFPDSEWQVEPFPHSGPIDNYSWLTSHKHTRKESKSLCLSTEKANGKKD